MGSIDRTPGIRPRPTMGRRLDVMARASFPVVCTLLLMLLAAAPLGLPLQFALLPALTWGCVWFWSLYRPAALPPPVIFPVGVLFDLLGYTPLGTGVLTLLIILGLAIRLRNLLIARGFITVWLAYAGIAAGAGLLGWALGSLLPFRLLPMGSAVFEITLAIAVYPALAVLFFRAHRSIADPARA
jgi:rod shape-determining protein MreD